jgi:cell division protein FtsQ
MDVFKPKEERQKVNKRNASKQRLSRGLKKKQQSRPRGAVFKQAEKPKEPITLSYKKKVADFLSELERVSGFLNKRVLLGVVSLLLLTALWNTLGMVKAEMPIERVGVKGDFYQLDKAVLEEALSPLVGTNYFDLDIQKIKNTLVDYAWVQSVEVRKIWPAKVEVLIVENKAIATWGGDSLVNEKGEVFSPKNIRRELLEGIPDLHGLDKQSELVLLTYADLSEGSSKHQLKIKEFSLVANSYWKLKFENDTELLLTLGREAESLEVFLKAYENKFKKEGFGIAKADFRYSNGFSVEFKTSENSQVVADVKPANGKPNLKTGKNHG